MCGVLCKKSTVSRLSLSCEYAKELFKKHFSVCVFVCGGVHRQLVRVPSFHHVDPGY